MSSPVRNPREREALAQEVRARVPQPIDMLEIAAVIESMGITDEVASDDYGAETSFELAEQIFGIVRARSAEPLQAGHALQYSHLPVDRAEPPALDTSARGLLALAPLGLLVVGLQALAAAGWSTGSILALSFGVTAAMLLTSGPIAAIARKTSIYLGFGYRASAHRFMTLSSLATLIVCSAIGLTAFGTASALELFSAEQRSIFTAALAAFAFLWLLSAGLTLAGASRPVVAVLAAGLVLGVGASMAFGTAIGIALGYGSTIAALAVTWYVTYPRGAERSFRLPSAGVVLLEAVPYIAFGSAFALFLVVPHLLGWFGNSQADALHRLATFELSLLLALLPVLLATGVSERILRSFWDFAKELRAEDAADSFRRGVRGYILGGLARYALVLSALSVATLAAFELTVYAGGFEGASQVVFVCGLVGFFLLGLGQFSCLFMLGLALPDRALKPLLAGLVVLCGLGIPLSLVDFRLAALAFAFAAAAFAGAAISGCLTVLAEIPRRYSTAF